MATLTARMTALETAVSTLVDALTAAQATTAQGRPAQGKTEQPRTFATKAEIANGGGFPCSATPACSRVLRTLKRSQSHGIEAGHEAR